ncbi:Phosphonates-binding protein [Bacillus thuringiensis serovar israelensis ATCC 35646]|nr:Phosphonates-binding protein [Bacillus thuringiensis serovar israelensis ATCC 35646]
MYRMCKDSVNNKLCIKICDIFLHVYGSLFHNKKNGGINMLKKVFAMSTTVVLAAGLLKWLRSERIKCK